MSDPLRDERRTTSRAPVPISSTEFEALAEELGPFKPPYHFAVALSGGPDSTALTLLLKKWADTKGFKLTAFIVDHALRDGSAAEALATKGQMATLGIAAEILLWEHPPLLSKIHATARKARYALMHEAALRLQITDLWLAHQNEDQAETVLMRLAKGSGIDGLAGIAPVTSVDHVRLLRPLLSMPKERLIATCDAWPCPYVKDPSNGSETFARGRLRKVMPLLKEEGLTNERLTDLASRARDAKAALTFYTNEALDVAATRDHAGVVRLKLLPLRLVPKAIAARVLASCLNAVHAEAYASEHLSLMRLLNALLSDADMPPRTLQGCLIGKTNEQATLTRETSVILSLPLEGPGTILWDHRWQVTLHIEGRFDVRPLGATSHETLDYLSPGLRRRVPQGRARASLPGLWQGHDLVHIPEFSDGGAIAKDGEKETVPVAFACLVSPWSTG